MNDILKLKPVSYQWNGKGGINKDGKTHYGIIAQDAIKIFPEMFTKTNLKLNSMDEKETEVYLYNPSALIYVLVNAIQEQQTQIEELKAEVKQLKKKLKTD